MSARAFFITAFLMGFVFAAVVGSAAITTFVWVHR